MKRKATKTIPASTEPAVPTTVAITSLDELTRMCSVEVPCNVPMRLADGRVVLASVPVRTLRPEEALHLELMLRELVPPLKPKARPEDPEEFDVANVEWVKQKARREHEVRCLTAWLCCGLFKEMRDASPGLETKQIVALVCERIPDDEVLRTIERASDGIGIKLHDRVNFTSGAFLQN